MHIYIIYKSLTGNTKKMAFEIKKGIEKAGGKAIITSNTSIVPQKGDLFFVGSGVYLNFLHPSIKKILFKNNWSGVKLALFSSCAFNSGAKHMRSIEKEMRKKGAIILGTLCLRTSGILRFFALGRLSRNLFRAPAFGEKITNRAFGKRVKISSKKTRIHGYLKQAL